MKKDNVEMWAEMCECVQFHRCIQVIILHNVEEYALPWHASSPYIIC